MSENVKNMEDILADSGFELSNGTPFDNQDPAGDPQPEAEPQFSNDPAPAAEPILTDDPSFLDNPTAGDIQQSSNEDLNQLQDVDSIVSNYLSERLGIDDIDSLQERLNTPSYEVDERVAAIDKFVRETGRGPEEWFTYQQLNPTEMDDLTAIKMQTMTEYPDLTADQVDKLVSSRYKLDEDLYDESDVELSKIQLQIDAKNARQGIEKLRSNYALPQSSVQSDQLFDENWISNMTETVNDIDGISFDLPGGQEFTFGLDNTYKSDLINKNAELETYFDQYIDDQGNWDVETLSIHRAVIDNMDNIVKSIYQQGLSDGQRNVVGRAANAQANTPGVNPNTGTDPLTEQLKQALGGGDNLMKFL
jgi:hypothetical protein